MARFKIFYQDGSTDFVEQKNAAKARDDAERAYGEGKKVVIQPEDLDDSDAETEEAADAEEEDGE